MKTKLVFLFVALTIAPTLFASDIQVDGIWYDFDDQSLTASVTYRGSDYYNYDNKYTGSVVIPASVSYNSKTYSVTSIGDYAFYWCSGLTSVTIPNSVTTIGDYAFCLCFGLTAITIPNSVTTIGEWAFGVVNNIVYNGTATWESDNEYWGAKCVNGYVDGYFVYSDASKTKLCGCFTNVTGEIPIPNSVTTIGDNAFYECYNLTSVTIPNSVTTIGNGAFADCSRLTSVTIPNSVTTIGEDAFYYCSGLTSVTIPNSVTTIGNGAFEYCSGLTSVTIGNSVTTIGERAFYDCKGLTSITIPNSVTTIGERAFYDILNIVYNGTATGSPWGAKCVNGYVDGYLVYHDANKTTLVSCSTSATGAITIPNSVTTIEENAFNGCGMTSVTIPNSVTTIGNYAFADCSRLTSVTIPNSVTTIGEGAFYECWYLTSVTIPNSVTTIGDGAFDGCSGLTSVTIGNSVTTIGEGAFWGCIGLTSVTIPNSVTEIGDWAFYYCSGLTSVTIGNSVTTIGERAFCDCNGLTSVTIPNSVITIGDGAFSSCNSLPVIDNIRYADSYLVEAVDKTLSTYIIKEGTKWIGGHAFEGCGGLTSITIPNSVTTIGSSAFYGCSGLTKTNYTGTIADWCKIKFSSSTSNPMFYSHNFYINNVEVKDLVIPEGVDTIGDYAFEYCRGLTSVTCYATTPPTCSSSCFSAVSKSIPVYVPARSVTAYTNANAWKEFTNIQAIKQGQCGEDLYWEYNDGILVISGIGAMYDYTQGTAPWMPLFKDSISSLVINNGCTSIGNFAFYGLSNKNLKTIDIPNSVEQIGQYAFANCEYIKNVYLGLSLEKISANAFANDERLIYITCYAIEPPLLDETAFVNYDAYLSVPCESQADYKVSKGWKLFNKENVSCIGAEEKPVTTDEVTVVPTDNQVTLTWPQNDQAAGYSIEITKDGVVFCTLKFNAQGQLTGIAFAPSRGSELRTMPAAEMTTSGWQFTVTGLTPGSKYVYTVDVINAQQQIIKQYTGEFTTTGGISTNLNRLTNSPTPRFTKIIQNNRLLILRNDKMYNAIGF